MKHKIAIVGSGPAGLAAAIYTSRAELETTIYAGKEPGGQLTKTTEIENYPGTLDKTGPILMAEMQKQATKFGAQVVWEEVENIKKLREEYEAVIVATGASPRLLKIGEEKYYGKGFSTCAVCDAAFYKGRRVYVVGGGDAAVEDAWALTKFAQEVTMIVRRDELRASKIMQKKILDNPDKVKVLWNAQVKEVRGEEKIEELVIEVEGEEKIVEAEGLFLAIGHIPATKWLEGSGVKLDKAGYIEAGIVKGVDWIKGYPTMTSVEGVFAAGDCVDFRYRQAATAAGMGVMAALDAERWIEKRGSNE